MQIFPIFGNGIRSRVIALKISILFRGVIGIIIYINRSGAAVQSEWKAHLISSEKVTVTTIKATVSARHAVPNPMVVRFQSFVVFLQYFRSNLFNGFREKRCMTSRLISVISTGIIRLSSVKARIGWLIFVPSTGYLAEAMSIILSQIRRLLHQQKYPHLHLIM